MLGEALRLIRVFHDYKISSLSNELGVSSSYISEIENNKKTPSIEILDKYSAFFDIPVSAIMFFAEDIEKDKDEPIKKYMRKSIIRFMKMIENVTK